jgi:hypothetical protein
VKFQVLTAASLNMSLWHTAPCSSQKYTDVSEGPISLMMEAVRTSETQIFYDTIRYHILDDDNLHKIRSFDSMNS